MAHFQWEDGAGVLLLFGGLLLGLPGAMLTLHLHPIRWFKYLGTPKR
jgi:hypothetical protein